MNLLDGQLFFALIAALILSWVAGLLIARLYRNKVLELMMVGDAPDDSVAKGFVVNNFPILRRARLLDWQVSAAEKAAVKPARTHLRRPAKRITEPSTKLIDPRRYLSRNPKTDSTFSADSGDDPFSCEGVDLFQQNSHALWRLRIAFILVSAILAIIVAFSAQAAYVEEVYSWRRTTILTLVYAWPLVPGVGLLERWSRWKILVVSVSYMLLAGMLVIVSSYEKQVSLEMMFWLFGQQVPLLVFVFFMTGPKLRAVGPYLLVLFFLLAASSLTGLNILEQALGDEPDSWVMDWVSATNAYFVFILFSVAPWLLAYYPVHLLARGVATAYRKKLFSEPLYLFSGLWAIALLFHAMVLSHSLGFQAYLVLFAWVIIPLSFVVLAPVLRQRHQAPTLLLLRVFRSDNRIESLFDQIVERWRYSGKTFLIAGKDLSLRTLEPDELFTFLSGHLQDRFISSKTRLQQALQDLDLLPDVDGRFRINEFFCFDSTWQTVLSVLAHRANCVLMDLRGYCSDRQGCSYELSVLAAMPHLRRLVILFDKQTDRKTAEHLLKNSLTKIDWIDSDAKSDSEFSQKILKPLLTA
ncbi:hypothetical protein [Methylotuvimicrobium sp. KM1]|uniref:hypothetical protein n=1 Tax=Methylotuvimicrobium sp. KM1 TaxID=3377707 RepID=UPI00384AD198